MSEQKKKRRKLLIKYKKLRVFLALLFALGLGYTLADLERSYYINKIEGLQQSVRNVNTEYNQANKINNEMTAKLAICESSKVLAQREIQNKLSDIAKCEQQIALYQHVMAPELSGSMLSVDMIAIEKHSQSDKRYTMNMVLLQPRLQKAVISGDLAIYAQYTDSVSEQKIKITAIPYRFKFFQQEQVAFSLPDERKPTALLFESKVIQFKRVRESFSFVYPWPDREIVVDGQ